MASSGAASTLWNIGNIYYFQFYYWTKIKIEKLARNATFCILIAETVTILKIESMHQKITFQKFQCCLLYGSNSLHFMIWRILINNHKIYSRNGKMYCFSYFVASLFVCLLFFFSSLWFTVGCGRFPNIFQITFDSWLFVFPYFNWIYIYSCETERM